MLCTRDIIPSKIESSFFSNSIETYKEVLYQRFKADFIDRELFFNGKKVDIIHESYYEGKARSFWHIISEGSEDSNRTPISWRAEVIPWVRPLIQEGISDCINYRYWIKYHDKTKRNRHYIWCTAISFLIILEDRDSFYKLITAYPVQEFKIKYYENEYTKYHI